MFVNHVTLSGGQQIPIHHQAREILHALVCPRIDVQRVLTLVANSEVGDRCGFQDLSRRYLCSRNLPHSDDPPLAELRHQVLEVLGLDPN